MKEGNMAIPTYPTEKPQKISASYSEAKRDDLYRRTL
jgi:hypothetical protein